MFESITGWWETHGFTLLVICSVIFFLVCWLFGWKPKKGRAGKLSDYSQDILGDLLNLKEEKVKKGKKRNPKRNEDLCRVVVEDIFKKPFPTERPDFLRNPESGKNLECDMMNHDLKLCIERDGEQHYKEVPYFHRGDNTLEKQKQRDKLKQELLEKNGYILIKIPYTVHADSYVQFIPRKLSQYPQFKEQVEKWKENQTEVDSALRIFD